MVFWRAFGKRKKASSVEPKPAEPAAAPPASPTKFGDIFGATSAVPPPAETITQPVSLEPAPAPEPTAIPEPAPTPEPESGFQDAVPEPRAPTPQEAHAAISAALAARDFTGAGALLSALPPDIAAQEWFTQSAVLVAQSANDPHRALGLALQLRDRFPDNPNGYGAAAFALRQLNRPAESESLIAEGLARCPQIPNLWIEGANVAEANGEADLAYERWAEVRKHLPDQPLGYQSALLLSTRLQHLAVTNALLAEAMEKFPQDPTLLAIAARQAARNQVWPEATRLWTALLSLTPNDPALAMEAATSLMGPRAERANRLKSVLPILDSLRARFPDFAPARAASVTALREAGRLEDAAALGQDLRARFPADLPLAIACAGVAEERGLHTGAVEILAGVRAAHEPDWQVEAAYVRALSLAGEEARAEQACIAALERFPGHFKLVEQLVALATRRGDFDEAARRIDHWLALNPANIALIRLADRIHALRDGEATPAIREAGNDAEKARLANLFARFESLGATAVGCEFGVVQAQFGAEPIGLLRWGNMQVKGITKALRDRFAGMGDEAFTRIKRQIVAPNEYEYFIQDPRYHYWAHTFIKTDEAPEERVFTQATRRLRFLRGKLIEDLEAAEKIFVFKMHEFAGMEATLGLFEALRTYGDTTLLCMTLADEQHLGGSVEMLRPGLFHGRVSMFGNAGLTAARGIDTASWQSVCEQVASWHDTRPRGDRLQDEQRPTPAILPAAPTREQIEAAVAARQFASAATLLSQLPEADRTAEWAQRASIAVAQGNNDVASIVALASGLILESPVQIGVLIASTAALRILKRFDLAEKLISDGLARRPVAGTLWMQPATIAAGLNRNEESFERWAQGRLRLPHLSAGFFGALMLAMRLDDAPRIAALTEEGLEKFPQDRGILGLNARYASRKLQWDKAGHYWTALLRACPDDKALPVEAVKSLLGKSFDRDARRPLMLQILTDAEQRFPDYAPAFAQHLDLLREAGRLDDASALAETCLDRFPADQAIAVVVANIEGERHHPERGAAILEAARAHGGPNAELEAASVRLLSQIGDNGRAEEACASALGHFPGNAVLIELHITLASRRGDFAEAGRRIAHWREKFPVNNAIRVIGNRLNLLQEAESEAALEATNVVLPPIAQDRDGLARFFARFESLGATNFGCEFGMVQRSFGADPIGLLRWGNMKMEGLTRAIAGRFEGMGEPANTEIRICPAFNGEQEYFLADERFQYWAHTFIRASEAPQDRVYQQSLRRLRFLRAKLLEDMQHADKIFVFKAEEYAGREALLALHDAMLAHGPCTLLCVTLGNAEHPGGTTEMFRPGLFLGRQAMFTNASTTGVRGVDHEGWRVLCERVASWRDQQRTSQPMLADA